MGRNSGSQVHMSMVKDADGDYIYTWYCQQHVKWDQIENVGKVNAFATMKTHLETQHGLAEQ